MFEIMRKDVIVEGMSPRRRPVTTGICPHRPDHGSSSMLHFESSVGGGGREGALTSTVRAAQIIEATLSRPISRASERTSRF
jgi:hypothetical protein